MAIYYKFDENIEKNDCSAEILRLSWSCQQMQQMFLYDNEQSLSFQPTL